jgi:hypothetical protein
VNLTKEEKQILLHSLGLRENMRFYEKDKIKKPYRNYFYTDKNTTDFPFIQKLIEKKLMIDTGKGWSGQEGTYFCVTDKGIKLAKEIANNSIEKLTRSKKRYQLYLHCEVEETFFEWLKDSGWNKCRKEYGV